jgi:hypothetical protein
MFNRLLMNCFLVSFISSCVSDEVAPINRIPASEELMKYSFEEVSAVTLKHRLGYRWKKRAQKVEWFSCQHDEPKAIVFMLNRDFSNFNGDNFCLGWIAQGALAAGYSVVGINRPGFGSSSGDFDYSGGQSVAATRAVVKDVLAKLWQKPQDQKIVFWGYGTAVITAVQAARDKYPHAALILGGGVYDSEAILGTDSAKSGLHREALRELVDRFGSVAHETRSLAWGFEGYSSKFILYHGDRDAKAPVEKARFFSEGLLSAKYEVNYVEVPGSKHQIEPMMHRYLIELFLKHAIK